MVKYKLGQTPKGRKTCLKCKFYRMVADDERNRTSLDLCLKKGPLPAAYTFSDLCCSGSSCTFILTLKCLEEIAEKCEYYEEET